MVFALFVLALALVPGLQCVTVQTMDIPSIGNFPSVDVNGNQIQTLPALIFDDEPEVVVPELRPEIVPEVEAVVPEIISINPCDSCFEYISSLIEQLAEVPELVPHPMPEVEVIQPEEDEGIYQILPHPMPQVEVVEQEAGAIPIEYLRM